MLPACVSSLRSFQSDQKFIYGVSRTEDCLGPIFPPIGVPLPAGFILANPLAIVELIGKAAVCNA